MTEPLAFVDRPSQLATVLSPIRLRILRELAEPDSAVGLARKLDLPRQKVNYHLRALEKGGFVELASERQRRGCTERCLKVTARAFVVDPRLLGDPPAARGDRFSSEVLLSAASAIVRDVALLRQRAQAVDQALITLTLQSDVAVRSRSELKSLSEELAGEISRLISKYHKPQDPQARVYRFTTALHPVITKTEADAEREAREHRKGKASDHGS